MLGNLKKIITFYNYLLSLADRNPAKGLSCQSADRIATALPQLG